MILVDPPSSGPAHDAALGPLLLREGTAAVDFLREGDAAHVLREGTGAHVLREGTGDAVDILRVYSPAPTAAFSRRDTLRPGYAEAASGVERRGYVPVIRPQGGSLAAYGPGSLVIDHVHRSGPSAPDPVARFRHFAQMHASLLADLGVPVKIGPVPDEYCPGEYSLNAAGAKIVGSAQRVTRDGWLFSTVIQVLGSAGLREVLTPAYQALGYPFEPSTVGAIEDTVPGITVTAARAAVLGAYGLPMSPG